MKMPIPIYPPPRRPSPPVRMSHMATAAVVAGFAFGAAWVATWVVCEIQHSLP